MSNETDRLTTTTNTPDANSKEHGSHTDTPKEGLYGFKYTLGEELANSIEHGLGLLGSVAALVILVVLATRRGDPWRMVAFSIYGASLCLLYASSTLYHALPASTAKAVFRRLDYASIYVLIAGTYTPYALVTLRGPWGWTLFGIVWGLAILGIALKMVYFHRFAILSLIVYIAMGWVVVIAAKPIIAALPWAGLAWLLAGGLFYTGGVVFFAWERLPYSHAIWHLFVLAGSACQFFGILYYVA
ncbi:MAG: hemolysin III family protein [Deltaproteobacteria bacterium]|nr:hemolysin III family protein [Deltaproteobacteria bacterium]